MGSTFNPQILVEKLCKLNNSQASIETLSHWCIFHMNKAKQVVETWEKQFHCSPCEQRLAFLYLANDILQNSRRKGSEFVGEFWKVLPDAIRDVIQNGDDFAKNAALRLISIWEERKVFGSRGQILKEELVGKHLENNKKNAKNACLKLKQPAGGTLDKIILGYQVIYGGHLDEDVLMNKCTGAVSHLEKVDKDTNGGANLEQLHGGVCVEEIQGQYAILRDSIEQLMAIESSAASLVCHLREALQEQESKLENLRNQLQTAQCQSERTASICQRLQQASNGQLVTQQCSGEANSLVASQSIMPGNAEQSAPLMYTQQVSLHEKQEHVEEEDPRKSAAAAVAAKLTASSSSAQMLSFVLSSLASEGVIGNAASESNGDPPSVKKPKMENTQPYFPLPNPPQPLLHSYQHPSAPPPPPSSPPSPPPLPSLPPYSLPPFLQPGAPMNGLPYGYGMVPQQQPSLPGNPLVGTLMTGLVPFNLSSMNSSYPSFQAPESNLYIHPSSVPAAPISRQ